MTKEPTGSSVGLGPLAGQPPPALPAVTLLSDDDLYLFNEGSHYHLYAKLGAHPLVVQGVAGTYFAVWAPNAERVSVMGDFNGWDKTSQPLQPRGGSGGARSTSTTSSRGTTATGSTRPTPTRCWTKCRPAPGPSSGTWTTSGATRSGWRSAARATRWMRRSPST